MVEMGSVPTLLACLSHENTDIAADTIELFSELTGSGRSESERGRVGVRGRGGVWERGGVGEGECGSGRESGGCRATENQG